MYDPDHHTLVVFGGRSAEKRRLGDVYVLDLDNWAWSRAGCNGVVPAPREEAAAVYYAGHMLVFGGWRGRGGGGGGGGRVGGR